MQDGREKTDLVPKEIETLMQTHDRRSKQEQIMKWTILVIVAIGVFMATLDTSIINSSLPGIASAFRVPLSGAVEWVTIAYFVMMAASLLTAGRVADMIGRKAVWSAGLVIFTLGSALCGAAPSLGFLIAARALQGLGGALLLAISQAMLTTAFPSQERGRALGMNTMIVALGTSSGPMLGGLIMTYSSWHWIFFVNVPFGIIGLIATVRVLTEPWQHASGRFDPWGAALLALGLASLTAALSFGQEWGWSSLPILGSLLIGIIALVLLPMVEQHVAYPVLLLSLLRHRVFSLALVSLVLGHLALFAVGFLLPFYLQELRGFPAGRAGLLLMPLPLTQVLIAPVSGSLIDRIGSRWLSTTGMGVVCLGLVGISQLNVQSSILEIIWRLMVVGLGQALLNPANNSAVMGSAPREHQGSASGFLATGRVIGQSMSIALAGALFAGAGGTASGQQLVRTAVLSAGAIHALQQTFTSGFHAAFVACAAIATLGMLILTQEI